MRTILEFTLVNKTLTSKILGPHHGWAARDSRLRQWQSQWLVTQFKDSVLMPSVCEHSNTDWIQAGNWVILMQFGVKCSEEPCVAGEWSSWSNWVGDSSKEVTHKILGSPREQVAKDGETRWKERPWARPPAMEEAATGPVAVWCQPTAVLAGEQGAANLQYYQQASGVLPPGIPPNGRCP